MLNKAQLYIQEGATLYSKKVDASKVIENKIKFNICRFTKKIELSYFNVRHL